MDCIVITAVRLSACISVLILPRVCREQIGIKKLNLIVTVYLFLRNSARRELETDRQTDRGREREIQR